MLLLFLLFCCVVCVFLSCCCCGCECVCQLLLLLSQLSFAFICIVSFSFGFICHCVLPPLLLNRLHWDNIERGSRGSGAVAGMVALLWPLGQAVIMSHHFNKMAAHAKQTNFERVVNFEPGSIFRSFRQRVPFFYFLRITA